MMTSVRSAALPPPATVYWMPQVGKYITKDFAEHALNEKRYLTSRGIEVPERHSIAHLLSDTPVEAIVTAFESAQLAGASLDRCQVFWNQDLGCFWLATRESV
ncbi:bacteriophage-related protein [Pandoraea terrae]|uniref:Bacteriophage-related protein n=1 Tax=Pandoraea terrae TaxID=1537710 RepID=A0A5E4U209_9BURK|nr:bacteriophage-related protein [Pandoraea terrae]